MRHDPAVKQHTTIIGAHNLDGDVRYALWCVASTTATIAVTLQWITCTWCRGTLAYVAAHVSRENRAPTSPCECRFPVRLRHMPPANIFLLSNSQLPSSCFNNGPQLTVGKIVYRRELLSNTVGNGAGGTFCEMTTSCVHQSWGIHPCRNHETGFRTGLRSLLRRIDRSVPWVERELKFSTKYGSCSAIDTLLLRSCCSSMQMF